MNIFFRDYPVWNESSKCDNTKNNEFIKLMQSFMCFWEISGSYTHTPYPDDVTINMNNLIDVKFINIFYHKNLNKNLYIRKQIKEICCTCFFGFRSKPSF